MHCTQDRDWPGPRAARGHVPDRWKVVEQGIEISMSDMWLGARAHRVGSRLEPYGARVPLLAIGRFAKSNHISHVQMEHSSIVKFIEWNWLNQQTGQFNTRDSKVNNIGSMLDPAKTGVLVPQ